MSGSSTAERLEETPLLLAPPLRPYALVVFGLATAPYRPIVPPPGLLCRRAREELPALRRDLRSKTKNANRVIAKHCGSSAGAGYAKAERDLTDEFVKLQVHVHFFLQASKKRPKLRNPAW